MPTRDQVLRLLESGLDDEANPATENPTAKESVRQWLRRRAEGDEPMRRAAARRSASPGPVRDEGATRDATHVLTRDHDRVTAMVKELKTIPGTSKGGSQAQISRRASIVDMIAAVLARHEPAEQQHLWPAVRERLEDGDALADRALEQEREGTRTLAAATRAAPESEEFDTLVEELVTSLRQHVAFEDLVFARLREAMSQEERDELGDRLRQALNAEDDQENRQRAHRNR